MIPRYFIPAVLLAFLSWSNAHAAQFASEVKWIDSQDEALLLRLDASLLRADNSRVEISLPLKQGNETVQVERAFDRTKFEEHDNGMATWRGVSPGTSNISVTLTRNGQTVLGRVETDGGVFVIEPLDSEWHRIRQVRDDAFQQCASPREAPHANKGPLRLQNGPRSAGGDFIDILVLYSPQAMAGAGGVAAIETTAQASVDTLNTTALNSDMVSRFRLIHTAMSQRDEFGVMGDDLDYLQTDEVTDLRNQVGADLVGLLVENGGCGLAWVMRSPGPEFAPFGVQVTARGCAVGNLTFAHETGHNMGFEHDPANGSPPSSASYPWSFGHFVSGEFRTVMSYRSECSGGCTRRSYFSNPDIVFSGEATGIADARHNARTGDLVDTIVRSFRPEVPRCSNGLVQSGELCDDGNLANGDGCSASCGIEPGFACSNEPGAPSVCGIDSDVDGVSDSADICSDTPPGSLVDSSGCSDAQVDSDGDGICNEGALSTGPSLCLGADACPASPVGAAVDVIGCADVQVDSDGDGVCNANAPSTGPSGCVGADNCPLVPNADQSDMDNDGIGDACDVANDDYDASTIIGPAGGSFSGTLAAATRDGSSSADSVAFPSEPDVWYRYVAPTDGNLIVDTCGSFAMSGVNTIVSVHIDDGAPGTLDNELAANDDWQTNGEPSVNCPSPFDSSLSTVVGGGEAVLIRISRADPGNGSDFTLNVEFQSFIQPPDNDNFDFPESIGVAGGTLFGTLIGATRDGSSSADSIVFPDEPDVWYRFVAPANTNLIADTCGSFAASGVNTIVSVHIDDGEPGTLDNELAASNDWQTDGEPSANCPSPFDSSVSTGVGGGEAVLIRVSRAEPGGGDFDLRVFLEYQDDDGDGVADFEDNCTLIPNADQRDSNGDGYGNLCDADLDNNGIVNAADLGLFKSVFFSTGDLDADFNGDGIVNAIDLGIFKAGFFLPPGPSALVP